MRIAVISGSHLSEVLALLEECGHEAVLADELEAALAALGGANEPHVVITHHENGREELIAALRRAGAWVLGAAPERLLDGLSGADDLLPLPADAAALRARLRVAERTIAGTLSPFFERSLTPMWVFDRESHTILAVNEAAIRRYGWSRSEFLALRIEDLRPPEDIPVFLAHLNRHLEQEVSSEALSFRHRTSSGEILDVEVHGAAMWYAGRPARMVMVRDVTLRNRLQQRLLFSDRLRTVGTLAGGVAHEINNPLAVTLANVEFALGELEEETRAPDLEESAQALREALEGAERVRRIVRDLHVFGRTGASAPAPLSVPKVVETALSIAASELRDRAPVVQDLGEVPPVEANAQELGQVVHSLLLNAAQAIPDEPGSTHEIRVRTFLEAEKVVIEVADTGRGIPPENLKRIFDPFFTTKAPGEGVGLGLSMCHSIVSSLGGEIRVDSAPGKGAIFRVVLPPAGTHREKPAPAARAGPRRRGRVLIVDDEPMIGRTVIRILAGEHEVSSAGSAREALDRIVKGRESFDVILCDLMMPDMTGIDLHAELGRFAPEQQVRMVFLTGAAFSPTAQEFLDRAALPWVGKPFDAIGLKELIAQRLS